MYKAFSNFLPFDDTEVNQTYAYQFCRPFTNVHGFPGFSGNGCEWTNSWYQATFSLPTQLGNEARDPLLEISNIALWIYNTPYEYFIEVHCEYYTPKKLLSSVKNWSVVLTALWSQTSWGDSGYERFALVLCIRQPAKHLALIISLTIAWIGEHASAKSLQLYFKVEQWKQMVAGDSLADVCLVVTICRIMADIIWACFLSSWFSL